MKEYGVKTSIPASYHGLKIVHFSDVHFGRTINKNRLENIVQEINLLRPDLVFFTGDLIDKDVAATENTKEYLSTVLKKISTTYGKYAVTGNHDYYYDYKTIMEKSDFIVLNNENDVIYNQNQDPIFIGGLESESGGNMNVNAMAAPLKEGTYQGYKIVIMHTPDSFDKIKKYIFYYNDYLQVYNSTLSLNTLYFCIGSLLKASFIFSNTSTSMLPDSL